MRHIFLIIGFFAFPLLAASPQRELYETVFFEGKRVGYHTITVEPEPGNRFLKVTSALDLTLSRYGSSVRLRREEGTRQTLDGKTFATFMTQSQGGGKTLSLSGTVIDGKLSVRIMPLDAERWVRWEESALDPWQHLNQFTGKKWNTGDKAVFTRYEPTYNSLVTVRATARERERTGVDGKIIELLRVELVPDPLESGKTRVIPSRQTWWLDENGIPAKRQTSLDGLGTITFIRTDKDKALAPIGTVVPDIVRATFAPVDRAILRPYEIRKARYRIVVRDEDDLATVFVSDQHQRATVSDGKIELVVSPSRSGSGDEKSRPEFLAPNSFLDFDDDRIRELCRRAVGDERDTWNKCLKIERFVRNLMINDNSTPLVQTSKIARMPRGDCRHHAFMTASLLRAAGIPSRTAIGLLYVHRGTPVFGFHMWAEALVDGQWRGLDSTLGRGGVSAAHIKVTDHSWHDTASLVPLLPVQRVVGKLRFECLATE